MSLIIRTDVTAVKIYKNFVLAGIGSSVHVFDKKSPKILQRIWALNGQKIYGFVPSKCEEKLLVFGGKQFTALSVHTCAGLDKHEEVFIKLFDPVVCDDWLHSAIWVDNKNVALLTAHNLVQIWDISAGTLILAHQSRDNSILYSGLLLPLEQDVLVMAGTVFSEVIVHKCGDITPMHHLRGHKGVIFSITCKPDKGIIVTTSDDRSVRIWGSNTEPYLHNTLEYWKNVNIVCWQELYGHMARVMRSCITDKYIVSVGEDSAIGFWDYDGKLSKKIITHQNGCIWTVDADKDYLVTGGGDCGVIMHPLTIASDYSHSEVVYIDLDKPKKVIFTARRNLIIMNENNELMHYNVDDETKTIYKVNHESTYKLLSVSSCKQMIAVADMSGKLDVFLENCKDNAGISNIINTKLQLGKILSMQWAGNRHLVLCSENGTITVLAYRDANTEVYCNFILPSCKERWLTASAIDSSSNMFILGDRCGNIHVYVKGKEDPVKTFTKVHGRYGPTSITIKKNDLITTGRDGTIKYYSIGKDRDTIYMYSKDLEFQWIEKFLDHNDNMICGFREKDFLVYDIKSNSKLLEVPCGGGHRSWDAVRYFDKVNDHFEECIKLVYLKNSDVNIVTFQMSKILSRNIINGSHAKEINCLKTYKSAIDESVIFYISGGEDTTLRISSINSTQFEDLVVFKHLSNIRSLKIYRLDENIILLLSAGGRAQICVKIVNFIEIDKEIKVESRELIDFLIKGTDKERKGNQTWRNCSVDFNPETRIMDLDLVKVNDDFVVFAGCSDACLRVFSFKHNFENVMFKLIKDSKHHRTCILKTVCIQYLEKDILVTCTNTGEVAFWDVTDATNKEKDEFNPIFVTKTNKSGINSFVSKEISDRRLFVATAGDDNSVYLNVLKPSDEDDLSSLKVSHVLCADKAHSSQITGLCLVNNYLLSTGIDQRITLFQWSVNKDVIECGFLSQTFTNVADVKGIDLLSFSSGSISICVFGKGMEVIEISTPNK